MEKFLYPDKNGMPMAALHWQKYFAHIDPCTHVGFEDAKEELKRVCAR